MSMDRYRSIRLEVFEVWEDGQGEFPLFITSDPQFAQQHVGEYPQDTITRRYWTREGGMHKENPEKTRPTPDASGDAGEGGGS